MTFADLLRAFRDEKGISQKGLADAIGVTQAAVAHWEAGNKVPSFDAVLRICNALGIRCTSFEGCEFAAAEEKRGRGRPPKEAEAPPPKKRGRGRPKKS